MNKIFLKGRLTAKPEAKETVAEGIPVSEFTVAVNRRFKKEQTDFINCQVWRGTAEFVNKYFDKGQEILVIGELHIDKWEKDGETRYTTRVIVDEVEFCGSKADRARDSEPQITVANEVTFEEISADDSELPF